MSEKICLIESCERSFYAKGYCSSHYIRFLHTGDPLPREKVIRQCTIDECNQVHFAKGYCEPHYKKHHLYGDPQRERKEPVGYIGKSGYRILYRPSHLNSNPQGRILKHRYVMSEHLKRPLLYFENVHHINGNKLDNRIENLELWVRKQPPGQRVEDLLKWAKEIINLYDKER